MKKTLTAFAVIAFLPAGAVLADDDCSAPLRQWQPREAAMTVARDKGWTVQDFEIDDGCYEIEGRDREGRAFEAKLDPATLQVIEMEYEGDHRRDRGRSPAPAGSVAPPQNGLFGDGTPPKVQVK